MESLFYLKYFCLSWRHLHNNLSCFGLKYFENYWYQQVKGLISGGVVDGGSKATDYIPVKLYKRDLELERKLKKKKWFLQRLINFFWIHEIYQNSLMASCRNTGFRSVKFYNNKKSKYASEFIISGAIKRFVYLETKKANKQTDFNQ